MLHTFAKCNQKLRAVVLFAATASILAVLATCYRQAANLPAARELYKRLYNINERQAGNANQSAVMLAKTIAEVAEEQQEYGEAVTWAEKALEAMQAVVGVRVHPYLEPFFTAVVNYKNKAGEGMWRAHAWHVMWVQTPVASLHTSWQIGS